jgi:hypothetical protein
MTMTQALCATSHPGVMRGLDPRIHLLRKKTFLRRLMDRRIRSGDDACGCVPDAAQHERTRRDAQLIRDRSRTQSVERSRVCSASFYAALRPGHALPFVMAAKVSRPAMTL